MNCRFRQEGTTPDSKDRDQSKNSGYEREVRHSFKILAGIQPGGPAEYGLSSDRAFSMSEGVKMMSDREDVEGGIAAAAAEG